MYVPEGHVVVEGGLRGVGRQAVGTQHGGGEGAQSPGERIERVGRAASAARARRRAERLLAALLAHAHQLPTLRAPAQHTRYTPPATIGECQEVERDRKDCGISMCKLNGSWEVS